MGCSEKYSAVLLSDFNFSAAELIHPRPPPPPAALLHKQILEARVHVCPFLSPLPHFYLSTDAAGFRTASLHQMAVTDRSRPAPYNNHEKAPDAAFSNASEGSTATCVGFSGELEVALCQISSSFPEFCTSSICFVICDLHWYNTQRGPVRLIVPEHTHSHAHLPSPPHQPVRLEPSQGV